MEDNVGSKVKTLASVFRIIGIIGSIITGVIIIITGDPISGFLACAIGVFVSCIGYLPLYAIGHTAENTDIILKRLKNLDTNQAQSSISDKIEIPKYTPSKQPKMQDPKEMTGSWWCSCGAANKNTSNTCFSCCNARPTKK